ncbi:uncharacterized protein LOC126766137 [Bactrocera neohumeralis]|uniref:uncharacterized protein LOC126766137 n=1 Tax=Bactrocera neohumeralis TaxID=98809 RepID=UPI0021663817|nr:uncharacterized protein LOC126766137 [Bactrocera neohumeralis]
MSCKPIYLIGAPNPNVFGRKLPTVKEVMSVFFYHHVVLMETINKSLVNTVIKVEKQWHSAGLPICRRQNAVKKLRSLHSKWKSVQKNQNRYDSAAQVNNQSRFQKKLTELFDIKDSKSVDSLDRDKKIFLAGQKSSNRRGIINLDLQPNTQVEEMVVEEIIQPVRDTELPITKQESDIIASQSSVSLTSKSVSDYENELTPPFVPKIKVMTPELVAALDRSNVSSRNAMYIISATLKSVGVDLKTVNISYKTIQRSRNVLRKEIAEGLKDGLKLEANYIVHWDGKLLTDITGTDTVDRLPIILTSCGTEQLLGVPKLKSGSASDQAVAILETLKQWGVSSYVKGMCFDTAAINTGIHQGTCAELEKALNQELIHLPCRRHIFELVLKGVFEVYWPTTSGPNVQSFSRFKNNWDNLNKSNFKVGMDDSTVNEVLSNSKQTLVTLIEENLRVCQPRDDYKELLELSLIFWEKSQNRTLRLNIQVQFIMLVGWRKPFIR